MHMLIGKGFVVVVKNLLPLTGRNDFICKNFGNLSSQRHRMVLFYKQIEFLDKISNLTIW